MNSKDDSEEQQHIESTATVDRDDHNETTEAERNVNNGGKKIPFYRIVLTGGPCGGKTTALERVSSYLRERGFQVITCPEVFSILASNGLSLDFFSTGGMDFFIQDTVIQVQSSMEDGLERILKARGKPAVLLCDRGIMDGAAYMDPEKWERLLQQRNLDVTDIREGRYNAVYHLLTAANGAREFYTLENNSARTETPDEAVEVDIKTQCSWVGHPKFTVIDNSTDFETKLQKLVDSVSKLVGLPTNLQRITTKFLLRGKPNLVSLRENNIDVHVFEVEKVYLVNVKGDDSSSTQFKEEYSFVRKRTILRSDGTKGGSVYGLTTAQITHDDREIEVKRIIGAREYNAALKTRDLNRNVVRQRRICFLYKLQSFAIHEYEQPVSNVCILHAQVESAGDEQAEVDLPTFLNVDRRLHKNKKEDEAYGAYNISLKK